MIKSGQTWAGTFNTLDATGAVTAATGTPTGTLYVDGVSNASTVTITGSNPYKWSVTLPSLTAGQRVDMYITGTIDSVATAGFVASEQADTALVSEVKTDTAAILADTGTDGVVLKAAGLNADAVAEIQSGLALEATLTAIKGAGWSDETLAKIVADIAAISAGYGAMAQEVWEYATRVLTAGTNLPTAAGIADAVWDEELSGHAVSGTAGDLIGDELTDLQSMLVNIRSGITTVDNFLDTEIAAILEDTNEIQAELADGGRLDLIIDAIVEDTGTTIPATLATIAGYTDGIPGDVWSYKIRTLTNQLMSTTSPAPGEPISLYRSVTNYFSLTDLGVMDSPDQTKLWVTFKENNDAADSLAIMQIELTGGLIVLNGSASLPAGIATTDASITVDDKSVGSITVRIDDKVADVLSTYEAYPIYFDVKQLRDSDVNLLYQGKAYIYAVSTRAIS